MKRTPLRVLLQISEVPHNNATHAEEGNTWFVTLFHSQRMTRETQSHQKIRTIACTSDVIYALPTCSTAPFPVEATCNPTVRQNMRSRNPYFSVIITNEAAVFRDPFPFLPEGETLQGHREARCKAKGPINAQRLKC